MEEKKKERNGGGIAGGRRRSEMEPEYDLAVIGGGSGGLAAAKEAARLGAKVVCFDFVVPSLRGTRWGLGGTCVNVGCIPKKLMHYSALAHYTMLDAMQLGWRMPGEPQHDWGAMMNVVNNFIRSLNFSYLNQLKEAKVNYVNAYARFSSPNVLQYQETNDDGVLVEKQLTARNTLIAVGGRPKLPTEEECPGARQLAISSDDLFWMKRPPGRTLIIGASYIALECAGFLVGCGYDVTVMIRSVLLRGFDQQCAQMLGELMECSGGIRFLRPYVPTSMIRDQKTGLIRVFFAKVREEERGGKRRPRKERGGGGGGGVQREKEEEEKGRGESDLFETVLFAIGREAQTSKLQLDRVGVKVRGDKILVNAAEQTNVPNIFALGDCAADRPELTPVAIQAGRLLARRLFGGSIENMSYVHVPTTVFSTPFEYGTVGLSEEAAITILGKANVETWLSRFASVETLAIHPTPAKPIRSFVFHKQPSSSSDDRLANEEEALYAPCLAKLVCDKRNNNRVIGFHYIGPNAGEITQGFALAVRMGATKEAFDTVLGIHPTIAEEFVNLTVTRSSGLSFLKKAGCGGGSCS